MVDGHGMRTPRIQIPKRSRETGSAVSSGAAEGAEPSVPVLLGCGISSSTAAMLATYPINIVRTRLQIAGMEEGAVVPKPWEVVRETMKADGMRGFYRGLLPNMIKVLPATGISYTMFSVVSERANRLLDQSSRSVDTISRAAKT